MAGYSARQSSFTTGDTITAAHSNDEFNQVLAAFNATTGHTHDGTAGEGGPVGSIRDADSLNKVLVDSTNNHLEFYVEVSSAAVQQLRIQDGAIVPITDNDIDLGTSSLEFKDLYIDGTAYVDAINYNGTAISATAAELNILDGVTSTATELNIIDGDTTATSTTVADADRVVLNDGGTMKQVAVTDLSAYFDDEITAMPNLTSVGTLTTLTVDNIIINGTNIGHTSDTDALAIDSSGNVTASQNLIVTGDLTVSGDDITMGTNTAGNLLIADGTNFNSIAVGSLSEISTVANDDVFLAVDTSGGGLKKIARSAVVSGLATSGAISNVVEDTSPQLGGDLDVNSNGLVSTSNGNIALTPNGSGVVRIDGSNGIDIESGAISIKNSGAESYVRFYCESSNAHYTQLQAAPHSAYSGNVSVVLPASADTLVGRATTDTLTNKTLTTPVIAEIDSGSTITLDATTDIVLDADGGDIFLKDAGTTFGEFTNSSTDFVIKSTTSDKDILFKGNDGGSAVTALTLDMSDGGTATFNHDIILGNDSFIRFGDAGEQIIGDGTNLEIDSSGNLTLDAASAINLDAGGAVINLKDDGTKFAILANDSSHFSIAADLSDKDIRFKGSDGGSEITAATLDMSDAGTLILNHDLVIADAGFIGSASDTDAIAIASNGVVTFSQAPVFPDGSIAVADLDIDGATDIGAGLADADLFIVDDGAGGTNRKVAASRLVTYINANSSAASVGKAIAMAIVFG